MSDEVLFRFKSNGSVVPMKITTAETYLRKGKGQILLTAPPEDVRPEDMQAENATAEEDKTNE